MSKPFPYKTEKERKEGFPAALTLGAAEMIQAISDHADGIIGHGEYRRFSLETITESSRKDSDIYTRKRVRGIPGCTHMLVFESSLGGDILHYSLGGDQYLRTVNA